MFIARISCVVCAKFLLNSSSKPLATVSLEANHVFHITKPFNRTIHISKFLNANISYKLSDIGEGIRDVTVKEWYVKVGDKVSQFDNICEVQSDKASVTITSRYDGTITKLHHSVDDVALVGQPLVDIEVEEESKQENVSEEITTASESVVNNVDEQTQSTKENVKLCIPSVRRLAKEHNINLSEIEGTGKNGRIIKDDVLKYLDSKDQTSKVVQTTEKLQKGRTEPIRGFQKAMMKTMTEALKIPHFVYSDEISVTKLSQLRKDIKPYAEQTNTKITFMPFFIKAVSNALHQYPILNSSLDENCENITFHNVHNIGVAMDTTVGLAVPVIKNVNDLGIVDIAKELNRLLISGKNGTFSTEDMTGGTFSISNIGIIGGTYTKPVILPPQVAIIAIGKSKVLPRFDAQNNVVPEEIVCVSASADHRVVDGASMASFIELVRKQIENPNVLLLNLINKK